MSNSPEDSGFKTSAVTPVFRDCAGKPVHLHTKLAGINLNGSSGVSDTPPPLRFQDTHGKPVTLHTKLGDLGKKL